MLRKSRLRSGSTCHPPHGITHCSRFFSKNAKARLYSETEANYEAPSVRHFQNSLALFAVETRSATLPKITIRHIDSVDGKTIVEFSDGTAAQYETDFLYEHRDTRPNAVINIEDVEPQPE